MIKKRTSLLLIVLLSLPSISFATVHNNNGLEALKQSNEHNDKPEEVVTSLPSFGEVFKSLITTLVKRIDALEEKVQKLEAQNGNLKEAALVRESDKNSELRNKTIVVKDDQGKPLYSYDHSNTIWAMSNYKEYVRENQPIVS